MPFDPVGFATRFLSERWVYRVCSWFMIAVFTGVLVWVYGRRPVYDRWWIWAQEALVYVFLVGFYAVRPAPQSRAVGWSEIALPLAAAALPFGFQLCDVRDDLYRHPVAFQAFVWLLGAGLAVQILGILSLGASFSITVEARKLRTRGLYHWMRHPIYLGQGLAFLGVAFVRLSAHAVLLYLAFVSLQTVRAVLEERKLAAVWPEYQAYRKKTGALFPRLKLRG